MRTTIHLFLSALALAASALQYPCLAGEEEDYPLDFEPVVDEPFFASIQLNGWLPQAEVKFSDEMLGVSNNIFLGLDDILSNLDWLVEMGVDLRYKQYGFMPDIFGAKLSGGNSSSGSAFGTADVDMTVLALTLPLYFRVIDLDDFALDIVGGARYLNTEVDLTLRGGPLGARIGTAQSSTDVDLWDTIVGMRIERDFNDQLFYWIYGDVGTGDSDLTWQVWANLGYRFSDRFSASAGYRYLTWERDNLPKDISMTVSGPILVFRWEW